MTSSHRSILVALFSATLAASNLTPAQAQDGPPPQEGGFGALRREGGPGEGQPREGGPREGGPREGGAPREGRGGPGGKRPNPPSPEQLLAPYIEMVPDLSEAQKTHILAIIEASNAEVAAIRANTTLSPERQRNAIRALRGTLPNRMVSALTDEQLGPYLALLEEQAQNAAEMNKVATARPDEDIEHMRERVLKGYEEVLEELSVKQKTSIIRILEQAGEASATVEADTTKTPEQKKAPLLAIHNDINVKVTPLLDAEQRQTWKKAHDAKRPR